jgi:2-methylcitrate dehydratase PrpD
MGRTNDVINTIERQLVTHIVETKFEDLPPEVIDYCKLLIIDSLGVTFPGSQAPGCQQVVDMAKQWGGESGSTILISGYKSAPPLAALANSAMMHALDFDDTLDASALHTFVSVLPAALAAAESLGNVDGKTFLLALALGVDTICRISLGIKRPLSWIRTATCGTFGAAASAGKLMNLDNDSMSNALGLAYSQTSGNAQGLLEGKLVKRMQPGFSAMSGVISAFLARSGVTGSSRFLEGEYGFYNLYERGEYDAAPLVEKLGEHFTIMDLSIKPYPSCRMTHATIDAALNMRKKIGSDFEKIDEIAVSVSEMVTGMVGKPFVIGTNPQVDAQFSIPYTTACALIKGKVLLKDFDDETIMDKSVNILAKRVRVASDKNLPAKDIMHSKLSVKMKDGRFFEERIDIPSGNPGNPMTMQQCQEKFRQCIDYSNIEIPPSRTEELLSSIEKIEILDNVHAIIDLMKVA